MCEDYVRSRVRLSLSLFARTRAYVHFCLLFTPNFQSLNPRYQISVQFSPLIDWAVWGNMTNDLSEVFFFSVFSAEGHCEQFLRGQGCPIFDVVIQPSKVP